MRRQNMKLILLLSLVGCGATSPQTLEIPSGATRSVGGGLAQLWFAQPTDEYDGQQIVPGAMLGLTCEGKQQSLTVLQGRISEPVCGVRVRLLEVRAPGEGGRLFRARFEITW